jgi:hypothetical protein
MTHRCDIYRVARQCGVILRDGDEHSPTSRRPRECYCKPTVRRIGRRHGEAHLAICFRLVVETRGNAGELYAETLKAVSAVVASPLIEADGRLFEAFDAIDLGLLRSLARAIRPERPPAETMAAILMVLLYRPARDIFHEWDRAA